MARIGYLGLGIMGYPMARNLRRAGHQVRVWTHTAAKAQRFGDEEGGVVCPTPSEAAEGVEFVLLCVGNTAMSRDVLLGPHGVRDGAAPGTAVLDMSTISPLESCQIARKLAQCGIDFLDAPCTGSKLGAEGGKLTFMVGGDRAVFERARPVLDPLAAQVYYCGEQGMGLRVKLAQNLIQSSMLQGFIEGIVLSTKAGVDPSLMLDVINHTAARSALIEFKAPSMFRRDFSTHFSAKWMHKDLGLALDLAEQLQVAIPATSLIRQIFQSALAKGWGDDDFSSIIKVIEDMSHAEVRTS